VRNCVLEHKALPGALTITVNRHARVNRVADLLESVRRVAVRREAEAGEAGRGGGQRLIRAAVHAYLDRDGQPRAAGAEAQEERALRVAQALERLPQDLDVRIVSAGFEARCGSATEQATQEHQEHLEHKQTKPGGYPVSKRAESRMAATGISGLPQMACSSSATVHMRTTG